MSLATNKINMDIIVREVKGKQELKKFIYLPEEIHKDHSQWVHPLYMDEWSFFNPAKNKSFANCKTLLAIAWQGNKPVGRIMGIVNTKYNALRNEENARFCFLECYEDFGIAEALMDFVVSWAKSYGMKRLVGPLCFSDKDPQGCLVEGFDERVVIATNYNFPWMKDYYEKLGFEKEVDLVCYKLPIPEKAPEYLDRVYKRVIENNGYHLHEFTSRIKLRPWIVPIFRLINEAYIHIYGFSPMEEREMHEFANRYLPVMNPRFIKLVTNEKGEVISFVISMPELSNGIRKARGRMLPFGWFYLLRESRKTRLLTMLLGAIKDNYRGMGLDSLMGVKLLMSAQKAGMESMDSHLVLEKNQPMRAEYERLGGTIHKRYRVFGKSI